MPPKKKKAAASSSSQNGRDAPNTFTTNRGKEIEATAAAQRPVRATQQAQPIIPSTEPGRTPNPKIVPSVVEFTGRAKAAIADDLPKPRGRGRPKAAPAAVTAPAAATTPTKKRGRPAEGEPPKKRGRPAKEAAADESEPPKKRGRPAKEAAADESEPPKKRGRPAKSATTAKSAAPAAPAKKRGRLTKVGRRGRPGKVEPEAVDDTDVDVDAVPPEDEQKAPKKRGRPPKGGQTTKMDVDDENAAEQLEEELLDAAADEQEEEDAIDSSRKAPAPKKGKAKKNDAADVENHETAAISGKQYWLMKAEQDGHDETLKNGEIFNTKFTIDDLRAKTEPEPWDGVRNPTAAKNLRGMKQGDLAFFYASGGKKPAIVGIMEIVKEHEPDMTAWDENSYGYVEQEKDRQKWCVVYVEFRKKFSKPITRDVLKKHFDEGPLSKMQEFNAARLSVSKVSEDEWNFISSLIEDNGDGEDEETDDALPGAEEEAVIAIEKIVTNGEKATVDTMIQQDSEAIVTEPPNGDSAIKQTVEEDIDLPTLPATFAAPPANMGFSTSIEPDVPTTDSLRSGGPSSGLPSSRPTSRGTGAKNSSRPTSRAGSLAPRAKVDRARSRSKTPLARGSSAQPETAPVVEGAAMPAIEE